jgi:hypothetical protein
VSDERPDERQEERQFLEGLKARTGRDLAEWMAAIAERGFNDKNEIIDWLRAEGLPFARASWLERIHRNGGKPIHGDVPPPAAAAELPPAIEERPATASPPSRSKAAAQPSAGAPVRESVKPAIGAAAALEKLLAAAKGYRPLYLMLEAELRKAVPGMVVEPRGGHASIGAPAEFAAVSFHATELRLGLALGDRPFDERLQKARIKGAGAAITHMLVLTDARQVNAELLTLAQAARGRVNG